MIERYLAAPLDRDALVRTTATLVGLGCLLTLIFFIHQIIFAAVVLIGPVLLLPALAYASTPIGYALNEHALRIERKAFWAVTIPLSQITACHPLPRETLHRSIRVYGTGGLFGWAGRYQMRQLGVVSMHATSLDRLVLVQRKRQRPILISPADPPAFLTGLRRQYETLVVGP